MSINNTLLGNTGPSSGRFNTITANGGVLKNVTLDNVTILNSTALNISSSLETLDITGTTPSTSSITGALTVTGGVGIGGDLYVSDSIVTTLDDYEFLVETIACAAKSNFATSDSSDWFPIHLRQDLKVYVWYKEGTSVDPNPGGYDYGIEVDVTGVDASATATETKAILDNLISTQYVTIADNLSGTLTLTHKWPGNITASVNTNVTSFTMGVTTSGVGTATDPTYVDMKTDNGSVHTLKHSGLKVLGGLDTYRTRFEEAPLAGTGGGDFTAGAWQIRKFDTTVYNYGDCFYLDTSTRLLHVLVSGLYKMKGSATGYKVNHHRLWFTNDTLTSSSGIYGDNTFSQSGNVSVDNAKIRGVLQLEAGETWGLYHKCQTTKASDGMGVLNASTLGLPNELHSWIELELLEAT
jgi:hypothetical protein